jgi:AAA15 family ATPase/GTPase
MEVKWGIDENDVKPGIYISSIEFNDNNSISNIKHNDIVVFVGSNNVGKSQTLKDIYNVLGQKEPIVIKDITAVKSNKSFELLVKKVGTENGTDVYTVMGNNIFTNNIDWWLSTDCNNNESLRNLFVCDLNTETRLSICRPAPKINRNDPKVNPIQYVAFDPGIRKRLSNYFHEAFNKYIVPDVQYGNSFPLILLDSLIDLSARSFSDETERAEFYASELNKHPQIQDQGDGVKSFVGILLYLMLDFYRVYLIDEPEAFLHPPQAKVMGQMIGRLSNNEKQIFISTHSEHLIQGLIEAAPERVKIVHISRENNINHISILNKDDIQKVWTDPILKYSNILEGLFYKNVVLCESDSDCRFYSIINDAIQREQQKYSETLFTYSGGKQRLSIIVRALLSLGVDIRVITDFDVLNNREIFKRICDACNIAWNVIERPYNIFYDGVQSQSKASMKTKKQVISFIGKLAKRNEKEIFFSDSELGMIKDELKMKSYWNILKTGGIYALPAGDVRSAFDEINDIAKKHNLFIVPVGELECFIKQIGDHGPKWVNKVLEAYPDLCAPEYDEVKKFVKSLKL